MANIFIKFADPVLTDKLLITVADHANPGDIIDQVSFNPPHPERGHTFTDLAPVMHDVEFWTSLDGTTPNTFIFRMNIEATTPGNSVTFYAPIRFKIGDGGPNTPLDGTTIYSNSVLLGLGDNDYKVYRNNYGLLFPVLHYTNNSGTGGFTLVDSIFSDGEEFIVQREPTVAAAATESVVGKWFKGYLDVSSNISYITDHLKKLIRFSGTCTYTFATNPPVNYPFWFTHFGTPGTGTVNFGSNVLLWQGSPVSSINVPALSTMAFVFDGTNWNVVYLSADIVSGPPPTPVAGTILGAGRSFIGDITTADPLYTIIHNKNISGDYIVMLSIMTTEGGNRINNNLVCASWMHHDTDKPNKFYFTPQEIDHVTNSITLGWVLIKV